MRIVKKCYYLINYTKLRNYYWHNYQLLKLFKIAGKLVINDKSCINRGIKYKIENFIKIIQEYS